MVAIRSISFTLTRSLKSKYLPNGPNLLKLQIFIVHIYLDHFNHAVLKASSLKVTVLHKIEMNADFFYYTDNDVTEYE